MSTTRWTNPITKKWYDIGTINWGSTAGAINEAAKVIEGEANNFGLSEEYNSEIVGALIRGFFSKGAGCPDYGLWGGAGWAGGERLSESENPKIGWAKEPCYNNSIRQIATNPNPGFGRVFLTRPFIWRHISSQVKKTWLNRKDLAQQRETLLPLREGPREGAKSEQDIMVVN